MTITDFIWIAVGETLLAATFGLGILVGCSLTRKGLRHDYDTGKAQAGKDAYWHNAGNGGTPSCNGHREGGGRQR
jgi:hypothetical protein